MKTKALVADFSLPPQAVFESIQPHAQAYPLSRGRSGALFPAADGHAAGCAIADMNADKKMDLVCIGTATANLKVYENTDRQGRDWLAGGSMSDRREFLKFLAGSPLLLAYPALLEACTQAPSSQAAAASLAIAADALDVYDFEAMARSVLPPAHWGYMATGSDGEETLRANPRGFDRYQLRVRRFVDVSRIDMGIELFGTGSRRPSCCVP